MTRTTSLTALILLGLTTGCPKLDEPTDKPDDFSDCRSDEGADFDYSDIDGAFEPTIDGDTLFVPISYGGGCEDHAFAICWIDEAFTEEVPVQADLDIWHDSNGDTCEAWISEEIEIDLTTLRTAYEDGYQTDTGTIMINIGDVQVEYTF